MMAIAIINAAKTMASEIFRFSRISLHRFSGVIFSMIQKEMNSTKIPRNEYTKEAMMYFKLISSCKLIVKLFMIISIDVTTSAMASIVFCVFFYFIIVKSISHPSAIAKTTYG